MSDQIRTAVTKERHAMLRITEETKVRRRAERGAVNALIHAAWKSGTSKAELGRLLGTTNRRTIDDRLAEHEALHPEVAAQGAPVMAVDAAGEPTITVERGDDEDTVVVTLDGFTHPDLGEDLHGSVTYDLDGDALGGTFPNDPMFHLKLWGTTEVQNGLR